MYTEGRKPPLKARIWFFHILLGAPLGALFFSIIQFVYAVPFGIRMLEELPWFLAQVLVCTLAGSAILVPSFTAQAALSLLLFRTGQKIPMHMAAGGSVQSCFALPVILIWDIEPSLQGAFHLTPAILVAAFTTGAVVAFFSAGRFGPAFDGFPALSARGSRHPERSPGPDRHRKNGPSKI